MIDWLKKRLTPVKRDTDRWVELAEALQEYWETHFDSQAQSLANLRNVFTADKEDLKTIISELGDYFRDDLSSGGAEWPIHILWRRLELQGKEIDSTIQRVLRRKFLGLNIKWSPLYAHKTDAYGTNLKKKEDIAQQGLNENDFFLSSRGKISLVAPNWNQFGLTYGEFITAVEEEVTRILPLHIVYENVDIVADEMTMDLYFGGVVFEGIMTTMSMLPYTYPPDLTQYYAGGASIGVVATVPQE